MKLHYLAPIFLAGSMALTLQAQTKTGSNPTLEMTAKNLLLQSNPYIDFEDSVSKTQIDIVKEELSELFSVPGLNAKEFLTPLAYEEGVILVNFAKAYRQDVEDAFAQEATDEIYFGSRTSMGAPFFQDIAEKLGLGSLVKKRFSYEIHFNDTRNPNAIAFTLRQFATELQYAEANSYMMIGASRNLERMPGLPTVYRVTFGAGDCPSGCMYKSYQYYEIRPTINGDIEAVKIATTSSGSGSGPIFLLMAQ